MKNFISISFSSLLFFMSSVITWCSQEEIELSSSKNDEIDSIYQNLMNQPTISLLSIPQNLSRSSSLQDIPEFTQEDLEYLKSLSQEHFICEQAKLLSLLDGISQETIDEIAVNNYNSIVSNLGGQDGFYELLDFGSNYLHSDGGVSDIKNTLPKCINNVKIKYYIAMAVYIDKLARPICSIMENNINKNPMSRQIGDCRREAETKLLLAGCDFGLDTLIEIMTGGADTGEYVFEDAYLLADIERIYYDYEVCMGRWH